MHGSEGGEGESPSRPLSPPGQSFENVGLAPRSKLSSNPYRVGTDCVVTANLEARGREASRERRDKDGRDVVAGGVVTSLSSSATILGHTNGDSPVHSAQHASVNLASPANS